MTEQAMLLPDERRRIIRQRLSTQGRVLAADLAAELNASEDTVRRDLRELASSGLCRRVYGGALPVSPISGSFETRRHQHTERKAELARSAASLAEPGQLLFLDAGTTNLAIAAELATDARLTVATNAPSIACALLERPGVTVLQIGGLVSTHTGGALGARAMRDVQALTIDLCFLGACAIDAAAGIRAFDFEDAEFKRALVAASAMVVVAATSDKLGTTAPYQVLEARALDHLIVEADAPGELVATFERQGTRVDRAAR